MEPVSIVRVAARGDADGGEYCAGNDGTAVADLFVSGVKDQVRHLTEWSVPPGSQFLMATFMMMPKAEAMAAGPCLIKIAVTASRPAHSSWWAIAGSFLGE